MEATAKQFHCPNCSADLKFDPTSQKFTCEYCRSAFTEAEVIEYQRKHMETEQEYDDGFDSLFDDFGTDEL